MAYISVKLITKQGKDIEWKNSTVTSTDGTVLLIAPYWTDSAPDWTRSNVMATSMYTVTIAGISHQVSVTEADVLAGNVIPVQ